MKVPSIWAAASARCGAGRTETPQRRYRRATNQTQREPHVVSMLHGSSASPKPSTISKRQWVPRARPLRRPPALLMGTQLAAARQAYTPDKRSLIFTPNQDGAWWHPWPGGTRTSPVPLLVLHRANADSESTTTQRRPRTTKHNSASIQCAADGNTLGVEYKGERRAAATAK